MATIPKRRAGVRWEGPRVADKMRRSEMRAINVIMSRCVRGAKTSHEWKNRTGILEGSIGIEIFARPQGSGAAGIWGSVDVDYMIWLELNRGSALRTAGDRVYKKLAGYIRDAL